ncbi:conserved hypothetical protein [Ixodes scapularis]|uniref:Coiled-coil domain-containing protein 149 n=1 Tax=Ixodes scapularis TaxID=6945 RepID=B7PEV1_IXOSC|nr:conserved hypothetical protein [Ixodes scapularis]|eukprot:XP_002433723.1 conserved hypothetical protein [Ixodes scapularis]
MSSKYAKLDQDYQRLVGEMGVLRCRLESKGEALLILTRDLEQCQSERDQYKLMADQLRERHAELKRRVQGWGPTIAGVYDVRNLKGQAEKSLAQLLCEMKEQNRALQTELTDVRQKLQEAREDGKLLREQLRDRQSLAAGEEEPCLGPGDRIALVTQLEAVRSKCQLLERDLQAVLDEKEELVRSSDAYRHKVDRLNLQLNLSLAEKNRGRGGAAGIATGISNKQMQQLLQGCSTDVSSATADVRSLVALLLESLNDRTLALNHQRKANKVLGKRITELESRLKAGNGAWRAPQRTRALSDSSHLNGEEQLSNGRLPSLNGAAGSGVAEAPRTVVCRDGPEPSVSDVPEDEDLPADLRRMLSAAMKELGSSRPGSPPEETQPSC